MDAQGRPFSRFARAFSDSVPYDFAETEVGLRHSSAGRQNKRRVDSDVEEDDAEEEEVSTSQQQENTQRSAQENTGSGVCTPSRRASQVGQSLSQPNTRSSTPRGMVRTNSNSVFIDDDGGNGDGVPANWRNNDDDENTQMASGDVFPEITGNDWIVVPVKYYGRPEQRLMQMRKPANGRYGLRPVPFPLPNGLVFTFETPPQQQEQRQGAEADQDRKITTCRMIGESGGPCFRGLRLLLIELQEGVSPVSHHFRSQLVHNDALALFAQLDCQYSSIWRGEREGRRALLPFLRPPTCWSDSYQERDSVAHAIFPTKPEHVAAAEVNKAMYQGQFVFELADRNASLALETSGLWATVGRAVVSAHMVQRLQMFVAAFSHFDEEAVYVQDFGEVESWQGLTLVVSQCAPEVEDAVHVRNAQFLSVSEIAELLKECDERNVVLSGQPMRSTPLFFSLWSELVYATWNGVLKLHVVTCTAPRFTHARVWDGNTSDREHTVYFSEDDELRMDVGLVGGDVSVNESDTVQQRVLYAQEFGESPILDVLDRRSGPWGILPNPARVGDLPAGAEWWLVKQKRAVRPDLELMRPLCWQSAASPYIPSHLESVWIDRRADLELRSLEYVTHVPVVVVHTSALSPSTFAVFSNEVSMFERVQDAVVREVESEDEMMNEEDLDFIERAPEQQQHPYFPPSPSGSEDMFE